MTPEQLRERREKLGLTQAGLADVLKVSRNTVTRWENGINAIDEPRSLWLDAKMAELKPGRGRPRKPRKRRPTAPRTPATED